MASAFDPRLVQVTLKLLSGTFTFQDLAIVAHGESFTSAQQAICELQIFNMTEEQKNQVLTQASPLFLGQPAFANGQSVPVNVTLAVGRRSYGTFNIFQGNVIACGVTQPPDIGVTLHSMTYSYLDAVISGLAAPPNAKLSTILQGVASSFGVQLENTATDRNINNWNCNGGLLQQVKKLNMLGGIFAYLPPAGGVLVVHDTDKSRAVPVVTVSAETGMVGVPQVTQYGVLVKTMIDPAINIGGQFTVSSAVNPAANGTYQLYRLQFDIANRDTPFWYTLEGRLPQYVAGQKGG